MHGPRLKTIIHLVHDLSLIGGISGRIRSTMIAARGRTIEHLCLSVASDPAGSVPGSLSAADHTGVIIDLLDRCDPRETAVITPNNIMKAFPIEIRERFSRFPIVHMAAGQLAFFIQDTLILTEKDYVDSYKASIILCLSEMDMNFHRQLGIHDVAKINLPVQTRSKSSYSAEKNRFVTYVGRIDFHAKGAERLVPIAKLMKARGLAPLQIFTTDGRNSPDFQTLMSMFIEEGLADWVVVNINVTDKDVLYDNASVILLPSKKESFGNVVLEAFSFGIPVIAPSYAPGPAEIIRQGQDGFLLDEFSGEAVVSLLENLSPDQRTTLSRNAFARHFDFTMEKYLSSLENIASKVTSEFSGSNKVRVFPRLRSVELLSGQRNFLLSPLQRARLRKAVTYWIFLVKSTLIRWPIIRWLRDKLR